MIHHIKTQNSLNGIVFSILEFVMIALIIVPFASLLYHSHLGFRSATPHKTRRIYNATILDKGEQQWQM